jgi:hypothetical protein
MFQQGIAGALELFFRAWMPFQALVAEVTGHPVPVFQRVDQAGYRLPLDERVLADTDTLFVFGLDHVLTEQEASTEEIEAVRQGISEVLGAWVREERVEEARTPHGIVTISHLVARRDFGEYRGQAQQLRTRYPEMRFLVSGPWMPYSFAA